MRDWSATAWMTGFLAVLISYSGPLLIFIQAAHVGGMSPEMLSSWIWGISIGAGLSGIVLSLWLKAPIITAWSAPGAALLLNVFPALSMAEVVGAYLGAALITVVIGLSGYFEKIVQYIPRSLAAAMMAGILFQFGIKAFAASTDLPGVVLLMLGTYVLCRRFVPTLTVVVVALVGFASVYWLDLTQLQQVSITWASPIFIWPDFSVSAFFSLTVPLVVVSLTGQYLPGLFVLRLDGYEVPSRAIVSGTGLISLVVAFFGGISIVLASITAAICTGKESHVDPKKRYVAGIANGVFYVIGGVLAGTIVLLFNAIPAALVAALAGLALIGAIMSNIKLLSADNAYLEPAVITFLITASNMSIWGMGSAFWGIILGMVSYWVLGFKKTKGSGPTSTGEKP